MPACRRTWPVLSAPLLPLLALAWIAPPAAAQTADDFYNDAVVHEIRLTTAPADWQKLRDNYRDTVYYPCDFEWRGISVKGAGLRAHGHGSRNPVKPALELKFAHFTKGQTFLGLTQVVLKNSAEDGSQLRDRLSFKVFQRMGLPSLRIAPARVYMNGVYFGLFQIFEDMNDSYFDRLFKEHNGYMYDYQIVDTGYHFEYLGPDPALYSPIIFQPQNHDADPQPQPIVDMIRVANQTSGADFRNAMTPYLDWNEWIPYLALEDYLVQTDGFLSDTFGMNNFSLYRLAGKTVHTILPNDEKGDFDYVTREIFSAAASNVLARRALSIPELKNLWIESLLRTAAMTGGAGGWLDQQAAAMYNQIRDSVREDPNKVIFISGIQQTLTNDGFESEAANVRKFIQVRGDKVRSLVAATGFQPRSAAPQLSEGGIGNAGAASAKVVSPGSLASAYGTQLGSANASAPSFPLPATLANGSLYVNGFAAPLVFVSQGQVNFEIPWEVQPGTVPVTAFLAGVPGNTVAAAVDLFSPGIFAVAHASDGSLVSNDKPAAAGEILVVYCTGLGPVNPVVPTGQPAPLDKLISTLAGPGITVGAQTADILFAGLTPGFAGLYQVNLRMPSAAVGSAIPLTLAIGSWSTTVPIAVR